jgi:hypothetical protein
MRVGSETKKTGVTHDRDARHQAKGNTSRKPDGSNVGSRRKDLQKAGREHEAGGRQYKDWTQELERIVEGVEKRRTQKQVIGERGDRLRRKASARRQKTVEGIRRESVRDEEGESRMYEEGRREEEI